MLHAARGEGKQLEWHCQTCFAKVPFPTSFEVALFFALVLSWE
jgi:hypothetical protein